MTIAFGALGGPFRKDHHQCDPSSGPRYGSAVANDRPGAGGAEE